ncbi:MAG: hypothetical protein QNL04_13200 [SAR324 cluster bacterium]|nr:hypothetical protein [SAR324 cluster bacterium]
MDMIDFTLEILLGKKKELLSTLLKQSARIRNAQSEKQQGEEISLREKTLHYLKINDKAIALRREELGKLAKGETKRLDLEIEALLKSIQYNNQAKILDLESQMTSLEVERKQLEKGNKLTGYLNRKTNKKLVASNPRIKRPLPKGGYGQ